MGNVTSQALQCVIRVDDMSSLCCADVRKGNTSLDSVHTGQAAMRGRQ